MALVTTMREAYTLRTHTHTKELPFGFFRRCILGCSGGLHFPFSPRSTLVRNQISLYFFRSNESKRNDRFFLTKCSENVLWFLRLAGIKKLDDDDEKVGIEENYYDLGFPI